MNSEEKTTKKEARKEISRLRETIRYYRYAYHVLDKSLISGDALDSLKHRLWLLEKQYPDLISPSSPTQRIGGVPLKEFKKAKHQPPMLSIEDIFSEEELEDWWHHLQGLPPFQGKKQAAEFFCEPKIDGLAINLIYEKGVFQQAATRGDGYIGEEVTANVKTIESVPLKLKLYSPLFSKKAEEQVKKLLEKGKIEIRGEAYLSNKGFAKINQERAMRGEKLFANSRNLAAGSIRQLDPKVASARGLGFLSWDLVTDVGQKKHSEEHQITRALGLKTDLGQVCHSLAEVVQFWQKMQDRREKFPYHIDGVVVQINDNDIVQSLGVAGKSLRGTRALKFPPRQATTQVKKIVVQVGRTGAVTPVAILEPVGLDGAVIRRVTLHNADEVKRLGIKTGDWVVIGRAGDVIPKLAQVLRRMRTGKEKNFTMPRKCPVCGTLLQKEEEQVIWRCPNRYCPARQKNFLRHFASKKAFDIEGLGPEIIEQLREEGLISQPADIFSLREENLKNLAGFGKKSTQNLLESIEKSKKIDFSKFVLALGIPQVGEKTARLLAGEFKNLSQLEKASREELETLSDIGPQTAKEIFQWFREKSNLKLIAALNREGVKIKFVSSAQKTPWIGKSFVLTGKLKKFSRPEAGEEIRKRGGEVVGSISQKVDFLICGEKPGNKLAQAEKEEISVIKESQFLKMLASTSR